MSPSPLTPYSAQRGEGASALWCDLMAKRRTVKAKDLTLSSLRERVFYNKFTQARYAYDSTDHEPLSPPRASSLRQVSTSVPRAMSVLDIDQLIEELALQLVDERQGRAISFETEQLILPVGSNATLEVTETALNHDLGSLYISTPKGELYVYPNVNVQEAPHYIIDLLPQALTSKTSELDQLLKPRFSSSYRARLMKCMQGEVTLWCVIEDEVRYDDIDTELCLAHEEHARVHWLTLPPDLSGFQTIPLSSRYWMGEYHYKRLHRYPCSNELPGFEYEAKLTPNTLSIDESLLPFEVIERYQTESVRWYLANGEGRVGFREGRASVVKKGKKVKLGLILKREEQKTQGLSMWSLSEQALEDAEESSSSVVATEDALQMRRVKRQLYLLNPDSQRVYALCLDYCYISDLDAQALLQVELEYNGRLCLPIDTLRDPQWFTAKGQAEAAHSLADLHPKAALRCVERALLISSQRVTKSSKVDRDTLNTLSQTLKERLEQELLQERTLAELKSQEEGHKKSTKQKKKKKERQGKKSAKLTLEPIEAEVVHEMGQVIKSLIDHQMCVSTTLTKRKWLKATLAHDADPSSTL